MPLTKSRLITRATEEPPNYLKRAVFKQLRVDFWAHYREERINRMMVRYRLASKGNVTTLALPVTFRCLKLGCFRVPL